MRNINDIDRNPPRAVADGMHLLVVIDHRQARVYRTELRGSVPERVTPYDPTGLGRHLHEVANHASGKRRPERKSYYEAVAGAVRDADEILVFGAATGASSAMAQLVADLERFHPDVAARVVGTVTVDEHHLTDDQLLAKARDFYSTREAAAAAGTTVAAVVTEITQAGTEEAGGPKTVERTEIR
jgi:hypothetical protein